MKRSNTAAWVLVAGVSTALGLGVHFARLEREGRARARKLAVVR